MIAAREVLRLMPEDDGKRLASDYVDQGGGLEWFLTKEKEGFLAFLAARLPDPSHPLTICRMAQALAQAQHGAATFAPPQRSGSERDSVGRGSTRPWSGFTLILRRS